jgi:protocatechuate 3,4-dioxygenase beta subunit
MSHSLSDPTRRRFLRLALAAPIVFAAGVRLGWPERLGADPERLPGDAELALTPPCEDDDEPTPRLTAGPFFKPRSPHRASLIEPGVTGTPLVVAGQVFGRDCRPVPNALLDFWHADREGEYDLEGFRLRGHLFADARGRYRLETIVPGEYPGRTRHLHVRVQAPRGPILTTQLFFPGEPRNRRDRIFHPDLVMALSEDQGGRRGLFHFVVETFT